VFTFVSTLRKETNHDTGLESLDGATIQLATSAIAAKLSAAFEALELVQP
jgi:hypothetical protein